MPRVHRLFRSFRVSLVIEGHDAGLLENIGVGDADFFKGQMDFLLFFYGLAFILLVATCQVLKRRSRPSLPWKWLAAFGATHGVHEWLILLAQGPLPYPFLDMLSLILGPLSFVFLVEFGRASLSDHPRLWPRSLGPANAFGPSRAGLGPGRVARLVHHQPVYPRAGGWSLGCQGPLPRRTKNEVGRLGA